MKLLVAIISTCFFFTAAAQPKYNTDLLDTLQQITSGSAPAKYFAKLYYNAICVTNDYAAAQPGNIREFIFGFESLFAPAFFRSYQNFIHHQPQEPGWKNYYADTGLNELQYQFMGMNAHINGDMWLALKDKYSYDTLKAYQAPLLRFQKTLNVFFDSIYASSGKYKKIKRLHLFTLGTDKMIGRQMILQWRKRQEKMALLFYSNPKKCERKARHLQKRMAHYDRFALHWIK